MKLIDIVKLDTNYKALNMIYEDRVIDFSGTILNNNISATATVNDGVHTYSVSIKLDGKFKVLSANCSCGSKCCCHLSAVAIETYKRLFANVKTRINKNNPNGKKLVNDYFSTLRYYNVMNYELEDFIFLNIEKFFAHPTSFFANLLDIYESRIVKNNFTFIDSINTYFYILKLNKYEICFCLIKLHTLLKTYELGDKYLKIVFQMISRNIYILNTYNFLHNIDSFDLGLKIFDFLKIFDDEFLLFKYKLLTKDSSVVFSERSYDLIYLFLIEDEDFDVSSFEIANNLELFEFFELLDTIHPPYVTKLANKLNCCDLDCTFYYISRYPQLFAKFNLDEAIEEVTEQISNVIDYIGSKNNTSEFLELMSVYKLLDPKYEYLSIEHPVLVHYFISTGVKSGLVINDKIPFIWDSHSSTKPTKMKFEIAYYYDLDDELLHLIAFAQEDCALFLEVIFDDNFEVLTYNTSAYNELQFFKDFLSYYNSLTVEPMMIGSLESLEKEIIPMRDLRLKNERIESINSIFKSINNNFLAHQSELNNQLTNKVDLIFDINCIFNDDNPQLAFVDQVKVKIGYDKLYTISNFNKFYYAIEDKRTEKYGKYLEFNHSLNNFTNRAIDFYYFLRKYLYQQYGDFFVKNVHHFLEISQGLNVMVCGKMYTFGEPIDIILSVDENNTFDVIFNNITDYFVIIFDDADYVFDKVRLTVSKVNFETPQVKTVFDSIIVSGALDITDNKESFVELVYPYIKNSIVLSDTFKMNTDGIDLIIEVYLDYNDGIISFSIRYFKSDYEEVFEDYALRYKVLLNPLKKCLDSLGFVNCKILADEDIYSFLNKDLGELRKLATVYISDSLEKLVKNRTIGVEFNIKESKNNLLEVFFTDLKYSDVQLNMLYSAIKSRKQFVKLDKDYIGLDTKECKDFFNFINDFGIDPNHISKPVLNPIYSLFKTSGLDNVNIDDELKSLMNKVKDYEKNDLNCHQSLIDILRPYQKQGVLWMKCLLENGLSGILADDMGIGKTLQTITLIDCMKFQSVLIVVPKNIMYNWQCEVDKFTPWLRSIVIDGTKEERKDLLYKYMNEQCIHIISYDTLRNDIETFTSYNFDLVILDEAQNIKNRNAERSKAVKRLKSTHRFALTGTPIENQLSDVFSIFEFLMPGYLYSYEKFQNIFENNDNIELLTKKLLPFILRRTKKEVLKELPSKTYENILINMDDDQTMIYEGYLLNARNQMIADPKNKIKLLASINYLREICVDPRLVNKDLTVSSAKLEVLLQIINDVSLNRGKVLVFSQFVSFFELLKQDLDKQNIAYYEITGKTPAKKRQILSSKFNDSNDSVQVFLVSLKAGGSGLNLIGADTVVHIDPWWNYAVENQATDRAYRIGQTKAVTVYKLIMRNTIEEKVIEIQKLKKELADSVINEDEDFETLIDKFDYSYLLN